MSNRALLWGAAAALVLAAVWTRYGPHYNPSSSVPIGWYFVTPVPPQEGDFVALCLPRNVAREALALGVLKRGFCPGWVTGELKVLAGTAGSEVEVSDSGISVDGSQWTDSAVSHKDVPHLLNGRFRIPDGRVMVLGRDQFSYDSRYYGLLPASSIIGVAIPLDP